MTKNERIAVNEYILSRCKQQKKERDLVPQVRKKFGVSNGVAQQYIRKLKNEGLLYAPEKNVLKAINV